MCYVYLLKSTVCISSILYNYLIYSYIHNTQRQLIIIYNNDNTAKMLVIIMMDNNDHNHNNNSKNDDNNNGIRNFTYDCKF